MEVVYDLNVSDQDRFNEHGFDILVFDEDGFNKEVFKNKQLIDYEEKVEQAIRINPYIFYAKDKYKDSAEIMKECILLGANR